MKRILMIMLLALIQTAYADGVKVNESSTKGCKGAALSKTIRFYVADETASKRFSKELVWQNKSMFLEKVSTLTQKDIAFIGIPMSSSEDKTFRLVFTKGGSKKIAKATRDNYNKFLVVLIDGQIVLSSQIKTEIDTEVMLTGGIQTDGTSVFHKMCPYPNIF